MIWQTYLNNASAALFGTRHGKTDNPHRQADALNRLKETIGLILLNEKYFTQKEYITKDLETFAEAWNISIHNLSTSNPSPSTRITLANGESMIWQTYLNNASAALFGTTKGKDGEPHRWSDALNRLKETIGLILLDESYFTHAEYIFHDLKEFAREGDMMVGELSTSKYQNNINARIYTGVDITWRTYLYNARKRLDLGKIYTYAQALKILKERAGLSAPQEKKSTKTPKEGDEFANEPFAA